MEGGAWSLCCGGCGLHDSLVTLLGQARENAHARKSLDLPPPQWYNPMRRGHHPLEPIMPGLALRCSNLRLWSSHQASPSSPHFLARLASRIAPRSSRLPGSSLPVPLTLPHFCSCVSCVSLCSGFTIGFPAPQSRARPGHDCSIFSTRLAVPSPAPWGGHVNSKLPTFRGSNQRVPLPGLLGLLLSPSLLRFASSRN